MSILSVCTYKVNGAGGDFPATVVCSLKLSWSEEYPRQWRGYLRCLCLIICLKWESCPDLAGTCRKSIYRPPVDFQNPWHSECLSRCIRFHEEGIWCGCQFLSAGLTNKLVPSCTSICLSHPETQFYLIIRYWKNPVFSSCFYTTRMICSYKRIFFSSTFRLSCAARLFRPSSISSSDESSSFHQLRWLIRYGFQPRSKISSQRLSCICAFLFTGRRCLALLFLFFY